MAVIQVRYARLWDVWVGQKFRPLGGGQERVIPGDAKVRLRGKSGDMQVVVVETGERQWMSCAEVVQLCSE